MERQELRNRMDIALALGGDVMNFDDLVELAKAGRVQLWFAPDDDGVIATEIIVYPRKRVLNCFLAAGALRAIVALRDQIEEFAVANDIDALAAQGSPAWGRIGARFGWRLRAMSFVRVLKGMH
jgi:hypothetical protein